MLGRYNLACLFLLKVSTNLLIFSRLSEFMTCSARFNIQSEGSISQLWNTLEDKI